MNVARHVIYKIMHRTDRSTVQGRIQEGLERSANACVGVEIDQLVDGGRKDAVEI